MIFTRCLPFLAEFPPVLIDNIGWIIGGAVVLVGLVGLGLSDVRRFSLQRVWAISGVCFAESIRRRVLWITLVAIVGILVITQLQRANDEQDAIRQAIKTCLFASGMLVILATIILACTSLPKEIENRVIYTIVSKPTTRLEIVLGKVVGFARVSGAMLIIMGLFTWGYLHLQAIALQRSISQRLSVAGGADPTSRVTLQHYLKTGLLSSKTLIEPADIQVHGRLTDPGDRRGWIRGGEDNSALVPLQISRELLTPRDKPNAEPGATGLYIIAHVGYVRRPDAPQASKSAVSKSFAQPSPLLSQTRPPGPTVNLTLLDPNQYTALSGRDINNGYPLEIVSNTWNTGRGDQVIRAHIPPAQAGLLAKYPLVYVMMTGQDEGYDYWIQPDSVRLTVPNASGHDEAQIPPLSSDPNDPNSPAVGIYHGRPGLYNSQILTGEADGKGDVAVYRFRNAEITAAGSVVPVEMKVAIERNEGGNESEAQSLSILHLVIHNLKTGKDSDPITLTPETNHLMYFDIPASAAEGGNFDALLRCTSEGNWIGLGSMSMSVVASQEAFSANLTKSLLMIWLLAILVIIISVFCSTFLSWPIAVVCTLVILLSHWGFSQLGSTGKGLGRQFVQDFGVRDPAQAETINAAVEKMNQMANIVTAVLPDVSQFSATDDVDRGVSLPARQLSEASQVLIFFGIPLTVLSFVFLKRKEVAP